VKWRRAIVGDAFKFEGDVRSYWDLFLAVSVVLTLFKLPGADLRRTFFLLVVVVISFVVAHRRWWMLFGLCVTAVGLRGLIFFIAFSGRSGFLVFCGWLVLCWLCWQFGRDEIATAAKQITDRYFLSDLFLGATALLSALALNLLIDRLLA
jgi:hypothetical protein